MTKTLMRFLKIRNGIASGKYDMMKLYDFAQSLDIAEARELINDIDGHTQSKEEAMTFYNALEKILREDVVKDLIRESMQKFADMGFCSLTYDDDGKIDGIHIDHEQGKRMMAYQAHVKGSEA